MDCKDIRITLIHNGTAIWEKSYKEEFQAATGNTALNAGENAVMPQIEAILPELNAGDQLEPLPTAETVNDGAAT